MTTTDRPALEATFTPLKPALRASGQGSLDVLLRVKAPQPPGRAAPRTPLSLSLVIDRSGSMAGEKLQAAKACAIDLVRRLRSDDEVGIVVYDSEVDELMPLMPASQARDQIRTVMDYFTEGGSTALHDGWRRGADQLARDAASLRLKRVILLSDGQANHGLTDTAAICERVRRCAHTGVSTSTVGLGEGFNEELMTAMAVAGQGNALYGDRPEDLADAFEAEIGLLGQLAWRDVRLVSGSATSRWRLLNDYARSTDGAWSLPAIAFGAEAWAVFSVPMDSAVRAQARSRQGMALHVTVTAQGAHGGPREVKASLPALPVVDEAQWAALQADTLVARRLAELRAAALQRDARAAVQRGDWAHAQHLLSELECLAADEPWLMGVAAQLRQLLERRDPLRFGKEAAYASMRMSRRLTEIDETGDFVASAEAAKPVYLRRRASQGRSS